MFVRTVWLPGQILYKCVLSLCVCGGGGGGIVTRLTSSCMDKCFTACVCMCVTLLI